MPSLNALRESPYRDRATVDDDDDDASVLTVRTVLSERSWAYLRVSGALDLATSAGLTGILALQLESGRRVVYLDLSGLRFIDCTGLGALVRAHNECLAHRGTLILTRVGPPATRLLELTRLSEALFISDEAPAARRVRQPWPPTARHGIRT